MRNLATSGLLIAGLTFGCGDSDDNEQASDEDGSAGAAGAAGAPTGPNPYTQQYGCEADTPYPGNSTCLTAPAPEEGFQLHYGPSDYSDAAEVERFVLQPGEELTDCQFFTTPNEGEVFWEQYHVRARPGTHHIIIYSGSEAAGHEEGELGQCNLGPGMRFMVGAQAGLGSDGVVLDVPLPGEAQLPENEGLGWRLPANTKVAFQMHYVNTTDEPVLREGWINFHYKRAEDVTTIVDPIFFIGGLGMAVGPNSHVVERTDKPCPVPNTVAGDEVRILGVSAHMHAHGVRFSAFINRLDGSRELFYETYDWAEPMNVEFDSGHEYPPPGTGTDGAHTGMLTLKKGESIDYECEYVNNDPITLHFDNGAYTAEMCNLFGYYTPGLNRPWSCFDF